MLKRFRLSYWLATAFIKKHLFIILLSLPLGFFGYLVYLKLAPYLPQPKPYRRIGLVGRYTLTSLPLTIKRQLSQGLTEIATWEVSDAGKTYTFSLNPRATWSTGQSLLASQLTFDLAGATATAVDDHTLRFNLSEPYAPFPVLVSQPVFAPPAKFRLWRRRLLVGTGPYRLVKFIRSGSVLTSILIESVTDKIRYHFYPSEAAAILGFKLGEVDTLPDISDPQDLTSWTNAIVTPTLNFDRFLAVFFNTQNPQLVDKNLRQALTYAIPQKPTDLSRALSSFQSTSWAYNPQVKPYLTNLDTAQELLEKSQAETKSATLPQLELLTSLTYLSLAETIKASWESLGITTTVRVITHPPETFQALLVAHQIPTDPDQYTLWHSSQATTNLSRYSSPKLDQLLEQGRQTLDQEARRLIYQDFQRFLVEDSPAAFISYPTSYTITRK